MTGSQEQSLPDRGTGHWQQPRRAMQIKALLSLGLLAGFGAVSTLAAWTSEATATATIAAGTVAIGVGAAGATATTSYPLPITGTDWYPGLSRAATVTVKNTGTLAAPYSVSGSAPGELGTALVVRVTSGSMESNGTCSGTQILQKAAGSSSSALSTPVPLVAGGMQNLCIEYSLPTNALATLQGKSATITLTFTATVGVS